MKTSWNLERCSRSYVFGLWSLDSSWGRGRVSWRLETFLDFGFRTILMFFFFSARSAPSSSSSPPASFPCFLFLFLFLFIFIFIIIFIFACRIMTLEFPSKRTGCDHGPIRLGVGGRWSSAALAWFKSCRLIVEGSVALRRLKDSARLSHTYLCVCQNCLGSFVLLFASCSSLWSRRDSSESLIQVPSCGSESALPVTAAHRRRRVIHMYHGARLMPVIGPVVWLLSSSGYCMYGY